jgi:hypothetical protein
MDAVYVVIPFSNFITLFRALLMTLIIGPRT